MLLLLLSPTLCDPIDGSPPGRPSLGFSRQEHWSGLPLSSPMHESEKWKWSHSVVSDSSQPHGLQPTRLFRLWDFPGKSTGVGCQALLRLVSRGTLCPPSDVYVRSFLCSLLYFNKTLLHKKLLSDQVWSLVPRLNLLWRSQIQHHSL